MKLRRISIGKANLRAKVAAEINAGVEVMLERSGGKSLIFALGETCVERKFLLRAFRTKMLNARLWEKIEALLCEERIQQLITEAIKRRLRTKAHADQIPLPGFEHLPRRIQVNVGTAALPVERLSVAQLRTFAERYERRARRDAQMGYELLRLVNIVREQPGELMVTEALARAGGLTAKQAAG